jgi:4-hydroxyphenylpyruvate dioxygenase-like putative hemolysin
LVSCNLTDKPSSDTTASEGATLSIDKAEETENATNALKAKAFIVFCCEESCQKVFRKRKDAQTSWEEHHSEDHLAFIKDQDGKIIYLVDEKGTVQSWTPEKSRLYFEENGCVTGSTTECSY